MIDVSLNELAKLTANARLVGHLNKKTVKNWLTHNGVIRIICAAVEEEDFGLVESTG